MKDGFNKYGRRLSDDEFRMGLIESEDDFGAKLARMDEKDPGFKADYCVAETQLRYTQMNLKIDHKFGEDFPPERREELWEAHERLEKRRKLAPIFLMSALVRGKGNMMQGAMQVVVDELSTALNDDELVQLMSGGADEPSIRELVKKKSTPQH